MSHRAQCDPVTFTLVFFTRHRYEHWLDSEDVVDHLCSERLCPSKREEICQSVLDGSSVMLCQNWMEVSELWMTYILKSEERPLGHVAKMWWQHEYQDVVGNLSHIHALLWLNEEPTDETQEHIRGALMTLVWPREVDHYLSSGVIHDLQDVCEILDKAECFLHHHCSSQCMKRTGTGGLDLRCCVVNNGIDSQNPHEHTIEEVFVQHSNEALLVLEKLGLYTKDCSNLLVPSHNLLTPKKHYPLAWSAEGCILACLGKLFVCNPCNQNLKIVMGYLSSRYLAKYVVGIDENNKVYIGVMANDPQNVELNYEFLHNTKVTGSMIQEAKQSKKCQDKCYPTGRTMSEMSEMEMIAILLGYDQVHTNIKFVHVPMVPLEEHPAIETATVMDLVDNVGPQWPWHDGHTLPADLHMNDMVSTQFV